MADSYDIQKLTVKDGVYWQLMYLTLGFALKADAANIGILDFMWEYNSTRVFCVFVCDGMVIRQPIAMEKVANAEITMFDVVPVAKFCKGVVKIIINEFNNKAENNPEGYLGRGNHAVWAKLREWEAVPEDSVEGAS